MSRIFLPLIMCLALAQPVGAATIHIAYTGVVTEWHDDYGATDGSIGPGTPVSGTAVFDNSVAPGLTHVFPDYTVSDYTLTAPPASLTLEIGSYSLVANGSLGIAVFDSSPGSSIADQFQMNGHGANGATSLDYTFLLSEPGPLATHTVLTSSLLSEVDFAAFPFGGGNLILGNVYTAAAAIEVSQFSVVVPEPALWALVLLALAALGRRRLRV